MYLLFKYNKKFFLLSITVMSIIIRVDIRNLSITKLYAEILAKPRFITGKLVLQSAAAIKVKITPLTLPLLESFK